MYIYEYKCRKNVKKICLKYCKTWNDNICKRIIIGNESENIRNIIKL